VAALAQYDYVGGRVVTTVADMKSVSAAEAFEAVFAFDFKKYVETDKFAGSGNLFVRGNLFEQVGGFRAGVAEDVDWCQRANAMGLRLGYAEKAIVYHAARRQWSDLTRRWDRMMSEDIRSAMETPRWQLRWLVHAGMVAVSPFVHWVRVLRSHRLSGPRARGLALIGLLRIRFYRSYRMMCLLVRPQK
jgi:GT2 family glycosyltransferase